MKPNQFTVFHYIALTAPQEAGRFITGYGYKPVNLNNTDKLAGQLGSIVLNGGDAALDALALIHPDRLLILNSAGMAAPGGKKLGCCGSDGEPQPPKPACGCKTGHLPCHGCDGRQLPCQGCDGRRHLNDTGAPVPDTGKTPADTSQAGRPVPAEFPGTPKSTTEHLTGMVVPALIFIGVIGTVALIFNHVNKN